MVLVLFVALVFEIEVIAIEIEAQNGDNENLLIARLFTFPLAIPFSVEKWNKIL